MQETSTITMGTNAGCRASLRGISTALLLRPSNERTGVLRTCGGGGGGCFFGRSTLLGFRV